MRGTLWFSRWCWLLGLGALAALPAAFEGFEADLPLLAAASLSAGAACLFGLPLRRRRGTLDGWEARGRTLTLVVDGRRVPCFSDPRMVDRLRRGGGVRLRVNLFGTAMAAVLEFDRPGDVRDGLAP